MDPFYQDEHAAVVAANLSALGFKRDRRDSPDAAGGVMKRVKVADLMDEVVDPAVEVGLPSPPALSNNEEALSKPYPFFSYSDFSKDIDPDPLTPLTPPGRVPNFPAKMHSILSRPDLSDIVAWMPHGRSWRVLKPREFEVKVIPTYFEHAKFSSFIRQANGWGFRRITQGRDRNSYYHELFLRGLPHLCKKMKRPGVSEKQAADPDHEPDLYKISEDHPVPDKADDDSILLQCTLQGGPKARMPIYSGSFTANVKTGSPYSAKELKAPSVAKMLPVLDTRSHTLMSSHLPRLTPRDEESLNAFQQALGASEQQFNKVSFAPPPAASIVLPPPAFAVTTQLPLSFQVGGTNKMSALSAANQLAFAASSMSNITAGSANIPSVAAALEASNSASQFAAGFAAAAALSQQHFRNMLGSLAAMAPPSGPSHHPYHPY